MRWFLIDRFTKFVPGQHATAIKSVTLSEDAVDEYSPGRTYLTNSLVIEGLAQTAGLLIGQPSGFLARVVLAKIQSSKFYFDAYPGDTLTYHIEIDRNDGEGAFVTGTSHCGDRLQAEISLMFAILKDDSRFQDVELFEPAALCRMCRLLRLFEVGVHPDGSPVEVPPHMVAAEKALLLQS